MPVYIKTKTLFVAFIIVFFSFSTVIAAPVGQVKGVLNQPDGTSFNIVHRGDEFINILTTDTGESITKQDDGYYYYASYDSEGCKYSLGYRVGTQVPPEVLLLSRNIPYDLLNRRAQELRLQRRRNMNPTTIRRLLDSHSGQDSGTMSQSAVSASNNVLVILAEFSDFPFAYGKNDFAALMNQDGYKDYGCARQYLEDQFMGRCQFNIDVTDVVTLPKPLKYYGGNNRQDQDSHPEDMIRDACLAADPFVDFSKYDNDGDGVVDNIFVFYAGCNEAEAHDEDYVWPHAWSLSVRHPKFKLDGVTLERYACTSELTGDKPTHKHMTSIGTFCHEYSHTLGLMDLYDTDYGGNDGQMAAGTWGSTSLMDAGNYSAGGACPPNYNSLERWMLGITPLEHLADGSKIIGPVETEKYSYCIDADVPGEFFLFECRGNKGWDRFVDGHGLLIYHVDMSTNSTGISELYGIEMTAAQRWKYNEPNANYRHQCADIIEADGRKDVIDPSVGITGSVKGIFYPYLTNHSFSPYTKPSFTCWSGAAVPRAITDITNILSGVHLVVRPCEIDAVAVPILLNADTFADAVYVRWRSSSITEEPSYARLKSNDQILAEVEVTKKNGCYTAVFEGLTPATAYNVEMYFKASGVETEVQTYKFTTGRSLPVAIPHIYINRKGRTGSRQDVQDDLIPLRIVGCDDITYVKWYFDDELVDDLYLKITRSGLLKAEIGHSDGSVELITRKLTLPK